MSIQLEPYNADFYFNRGVSRKSLNVNLVALKDFSKAISLNPLVHKFYMNRALLKII